MKISNENKSEILIVAGEASSALYAQRLLEQWKKENLNIHAFGVGSRDMEALGFEVFGRSEDMAVVGLQEVLAHYKDIKKCFNQLVDEASKRKPRLALLLDYPDFNLRLAKKLKKLGIPVVYYISPQVWAWRKSRIKTIQKYVDKMLVLFPFEKDFYNKNNVDVEFVGHPLLDELDDKYLSHAYYQEHRQKFGVNDNEILIGLMPGSRNSELNHHLDIQLNVAKKLSQVNSNIKIALFVAPTFDVTSIKNRLGNLDFPLIVVKDDPFEMIHMADIILCASGTATLLVGLLEKPMTIMYKMNTFTAMLAKFFVKDTPYFGMINLVLNKQVANEYFQEKASVKNLIADVQRLIDSSEVRTKMSEELKQAKHCLGDKGASGKVTSAIKEYLEMT